ncbi:ATP phosphoribosyltransferase [Chloroflexota bacterium]
MPIKVALPKGRLLNETAVLLQEAGWEINNYHEGTRYYRLQSRNFPNLVIKLFQEKDIPIQVGIGNYDLGICGLDWVEELLVKYPNSALVRVKDLKYGVGVLRMVGIRFKDSPALLELQMRSDVIRIVSEYPNLAESFAAKLRLKRYCVFPLWGASEVYPPESADLALLDGKIEGKSFDYGLMQVCKVLGFSAYLIANRNSWESKDMGQEVASISKQAAEKTNLSYVDVKGDTPRIQSYTPMKLTEDIVRIALPDGHQQPPTICLLSQAGIQIDDTLATGNRRPKTNLDGVVIKVIRPQDMPLQVANGNFDLAITGRDWLREHLYQFPSSPVTELLDFKFGKVTVVAVVSRDSFIGDINSLRKLSTDRLTPLRVASEYVNIADKYARDNHLGLYRIVPTWGASEAFLPEDADLLVENSQTGGTIARHNLKIIDTIFESTACLIGNTDKISNIVKCNRIESIIAVLRIAAENLK